MYAEESLFTAKSANGPAFSLKNNFGWKDKQEREIYGPDGQPLEGATITATPMEVAVKIAYILRQQLDSEQKQKPIEVTAGEPELKQKDNG